MTIALGINFGSYILLAADTRVTYYDLSYRRVGCSDAHEKIHKTNLGIVTGAGNVELLKLVRNRFDAIDQIISTDQVKNMVDEEILRHRTLNPQVPEKIIESTGWIFGYMTFAEGTPTLRLGVIRSSETIMGRRHLVNDYPYIIPPFEATEKDFDFITNFLKESIKPADQFETLHDSIQHHWPLIAILIRAIQPKFPSISSSCQIGVFTLDGFTGISSILKDTDTNASITLEAPPPPLSVISTLGHLTTLTNEAYRFSIVYPETWKIEEARSRFDPIRVCIFLPTGNYAENVSVAMYSLEPNAALDDVIKYATNDILKLKDASILSKGSSTITNHPSYVVVFQAILPVQLSEMSPAAQEMAMKMKQIYAVNNNALYVVTYKMAPDKFDKYLALAQRVMNSFAFV